jgi:hypothetical protein
MNMNDEQIEQLLQRYQPLPPSGALRDRVLNAAAVPRRVPLRAWDYGLIAASAALVIAAAATRPHSGKRNPTAVEMAHQLDVQEMAARVGGPAAAAIAETLVPWPDPRWQVEE